MRIGIIAVGTRGDVQPCIVIGNSLQAEGHTVTLIAGGGFAETITKHGLGFIDVGVDIRAVMSGATGRSWVGGSRWLELYHIRQTFMAVAQPIIGQLIAHIPTFDVVITGLTMLPVTLPVAQYAGIPLINLLFAPVYPSQAGTANLIAVRPRATSRLNLITQPLMLRGMWYVGGEAAQITCEQLGMPPITYDTFVDAWLETPTVIAVSPLIAHPPPDYPDHVQVTGFLFQDMLVWYPPPDLEAFLNAGPPPIYIGFGSMAGYRNTSPLPMILKALDGRRAVINRGWAAIATEPVPDSVFVLDDAPHGWLFPRMAAIVHHGGAGTTAVGLRSGVPSVIIPHIADQPFYGRRVHELGCGPAPIPRRGLNARKLKHALDQVLHDAQMRSRAANIGQAIANEEGLADTLAAIQTHLHSM
jgi:sterol 3beta-glucosyltransferase